MQPNKDRVNDTDDQPQQKRKKKKKKTKMMKEQKKISKTFHSKKNKSKTILSCVYDFKDQINFSHVQISPIDESN